MTNNKMYFIANWKMFGEKGSINTLNSVIKLSKNSKYKNDNNPLDANCSNLSLNKYSKNYLNHLFNTNEILASMLLTLHNINFYQELMRRIRDNIKKGTFNEFHDLFMFLLCLMLSHFFLHSFPSPYIHAVVAVIVVP